jgi:hypothetical protein
MGIMVMWGTDGTAGAPPPVSTTRVPSPTGTSENDNHGGGPASSPTCPSCRRPATDLVSIADFTYGPATSGLYNDVPWCSPVGRSVRQHDALENGIWHTITACKAPCTGDTGVAYPLADADIQFDSGQLGKAGVPTAGRLDWSIPTDLPLGTYTYFCRVHPSMRGAFRVATDAPAPTPATSTPTG